VRVCVCERALARGCVFVGARVCVCVCACVCVVFLASLLVRFPVYSVGLVVSLYDTHQTTVGMKLMYFLNRGFDNSGRN